MNTKATFKVKFEHGLGMIRFPDALKRLSEATIRCCSLYVPGNRKINNQCLFLVCDSSYFRDPNFEKKLNIMTDFPMRATTKFFPAGQNPVLPLTINPENIHLKIVDFDDNVQDISAIGVFEIECKCRDKLLLI